MAMMGTSRPGPASGKSNEARPPVSTRRLSEEGGGKPTVEMRLLVLTDAFRGFEPVHEGHLSQATRLADAKCSSRGRDGRHLAIHQDEVKGALQ